MRSRTQEAAICAGIGSFQEELHGLHDSYEEALKDLLSATHTVIDRNQPSALKQTIMHNLNWLARIIFTYFLMMNESHVRSRLRAMANALSGNDMQTIYSVIFWLYEKLDALFSLSFHADPQKAMPEISSCGSADEIYDFLLRIYHSLSSPYEIQRNDASHRQLREILYHILNNHTSQRLSLHDVAERLSSVNIISESCFTAARISLSSNF